MFQKQIRTTALARKINVPQPTLHRIVEGITPTPHQSTIETIAKYFQITVDQLRGKKPIPSLQTSNENSKMIELPILEWKTLQYWPNLPKNSNTANAIETIPINIKKYSEKALAVKLEDNSMAPQFPLGTLLIIDPNRQIYDRCYVLIKLKNKEKLIFRQLLMNANKYYLKPLSFDLQGLAMIALTKQDKIIGTLVEARQDF